VVFFPVLFERNSYRYLYGLCVAMEMLGRGKHRRRTILFIKKTENRGKEENVIIPMLRNFSTTKIKSPTVVEIYQSF